MEVVTMKVGLVRRASGEVHAGSEMIVKAIERIRATARENTELSVRLKSSVDVMNTQVEALRKEIERFTIAEGAS